MPDPKNSVPKPATPRGAKFSLTARILVVFLSLVVVSLAIIGSLAVVTLREMGNYALQRQELLGQSAIQDSSAALRKLGETLIEQKARDLALLVGAYIKAHPAMTIADLQRDPTFRRLAVQPVGRTGYTIVLDLNNGTYYFHKYRETFENRRAADLFNDPASPYYNPQVWAQQKIICGGRQDTGAYFDWKEPDGTVRPKYFWASMVDATPADGVQLYVCATTYIDEFSRPVRDTAKKIGAAIASSQDFLQARQNARFYAFTGFFLAVLITAAWLACWLARTIIRPVKSIAEAAQAMEKGALDGAVAAALGRRQGKDEVSALSRVFARMASEVAARESRLKKQMEDLQIEIDQAKNARRTAEIVDTDFFRTLKEKAQQLREK